MLVQLNPPIPLWHPASKQPVSAILVTDYSPEHELIFTVIRLDGQIWCYKHNELRGLESETLGRPAS